MVELRAKPYRLSGGDAAWVRAAIASMTDEEKVGQLLFCGNAAWDGTPRELVERYHIGGFHSAGLQSKRVREISHALQTASPIPLFLACATERGGSGAAADGTYIARGRKIAATGRPQYARELGFLANEEAAAMGSNMAFAPACGLRPGGESDASLRRITDMGAAYVTGVHELPGYASVCRYFPAASRDARCSGGGAGFSREDWTAACGRVYSALIDAGVDGVMVAGCLPSGSGTEWEPARLLRDGLGFNGLVICDTTAITGTARGELLSAAVNGGCDMLLCPGGVEEDFDRLLAAFRDGVISGGRMDDALARILGLKARMGLNRRPREELVPSAAALTAILGAPKYKAAAETITRDAITLVRCRTPGLLPLTPEKYRRVLLVDVDAPDAVRSDSSPAELLCGRLRDKGFDAAVLGAAGEGEEGPLQAPELVLLLSGAERLQLGGEGILRFSGVPAIGINVGVPVPPSDAAALDGLINAFDAQPFTMDVLVEKLLAGPEAFTGIDLSGS